ncbi:glycosyltransferase family 2 protein [Phocaeicola sp.]
MVKVSIIIPIYRVEEYIESCVRSLMLQDYPNIECILVDDCSPDNSIVKLCLLINNYNGGIDFKIIHHDKNMGLSAARNTGIKQASGDYLYFLDSDDELSCHAITKMVFLAEKYHSDVIIGNFEIVGNNNGISDVVLGKYVTIDRECLFTNKDISYTYFKEQWFAMAWNKLIKRTLLEEYELFFPEGLLHEDLLWSLKLAACASTMSICRDCTYIYKLRGDSISGQIKRRNISDLLQIAKMSDSVVLSYSHNKYLKGKLHSIVNFIMRNIVNSSLERNEKIDAIMLLKSIISRKNSLCLPLSMSDLLKQVLFKLPSFLIYYIIQLYSVNETSK